MPAPKGNNYAKGNKGGGRKSAYEEASDAAWLWDVWNTEQDYLALKEKVKDKKAYSVKEIVLWKALNGDVPLLKAMADKMLPDKIKPDQEKILIIDVPESEKACNALAAEYESKLKEILLKT